jgi:hypothetical protein
MNAKEISLGTEPKGIYSVATSAMLELKQPPTRPLAITSKPGFHPERSIVQESETLRRTDPHVRMLKIEADGDFFKGLIKPKIRLMGYWLERAGFRPGKRVHVTCVSPGVIELHSLDGETVTETKQPSSDEPECPF